jgi:hypothetical protein
MKHLRILSVAVLFALTAQLLPAQLRINYFYAGISVGATNYKGDLDDNFTYKFTKPGLGFIGGYHFHPHMNLRLTFNQGWMRASDQLAFVDVPRTRRNLSFRSPVTEMAATVTYEFFGTTRKYKFRPKYTPYMLAGIGVFYFRPQAKLGNEWIDLQPLGTEGQFLPNCPTCPKPYRLVQVSIPMGLGVRYRLTERIDLWFEIGMRKTFTDYIDDVSSLYPNLDDLRAQNPTAAILSDRMDRSQYPEGAKFWNGIRGDHTQKDWYVLSMFSATYILDWVKCPKFR